MVADWHELHLSSLSSCSVLLLVKLAEVAMPSWSQPNWRGRGERERERGGRQKGEREAKMVCSTSSC